MKDKVIAVTGASSGIGEAIARRLSSEGARLVLGARRIERLEKLVSELAGPAVSVSLDVTKREQFQAFVERAVSEFGRLDVLINNAGVMPISPLAADRVEEWEQMVDVNIKGVLYGISAALPPKSNRADTLSTSVRWPDTWSFPVRPSIAAQNTPFGP